MGFEFAYKFCVGDFLEPIGWDFLIVDDEEGVGALDARAFVGGRSSNALTQAADFIAVGLVPCVLVLGMAVELAIVKCMASVEVQDRHSPVFKEHGGLLETVRRGWINDIGLWELVTGAGSYGSRRQMAVLGESLAGNRFR